MALELDVFDISWVNVAAPDTNMAQSIALPLGGVWQPNDWRIVVACGDLWKSGFNFVDSYDSGTFQLVYAASALPAGWSSLASFAFNESGQRGTRSMVIAHKLAEGDTDDELSLINPAGSSDVVGATNYRAWFSPIEQPALFAFTVRGCDPAFTPTAQFPTVSGVTGPPRVYTYASRTLSNLPGFEVFVYGNTIGSNDKPSGWTVLWDNGTCMDNVRRPNSLFKSMALIGKRYTSSPSGATSFTSTDGDSSGIQKILADRGVPLNSAVLYFKQSQDLTPALTAGAAETYTASAVTASFGTVTNPVLQPGTAETYTSGQMFGDLTGYGVTNPYLLPGDPVASSRISWNTIYTPGHSGATVKASLDWGRTWTTCVNGQPVPGLRTGDTVTDAVLFRVDLWRDSTAVAKPKVYLDPEITVDSGRNELVPLGTFLLKATDIEASPDSLPGVGSAGTGVTSVGGGQRGGGTGITLKAVDLSLAISEHIWERPYFIRAGTLYSDALRQMVLDRLPGQTRFDIAGTLETCPLLVYGTVPGADPWQDIRELAIAIGWDCYFDAYGTFVARPVVDPALATPVWTFRQLLGPPVTNVLRSLTRAEVFNHIIIDGAAVSPETGKAVVPVHAEWKNLDPNHPTFIGGKFGIKPYKVTLPAITSDDQAQTAADALGILLREGAETVDLTVPPIPTLVLGDVIGLDLDDVKLDGNYAIHAMQTPGSSARGQRLTCFRQSRALSLAA